MATKKTATEIPTKPATTDSILISVEARGVNETLMSNGQMSNPLNPFARALKVLTKKKNKTEDDYLEIARTEFLGNIYQSATLGTVWPSDNIEAMIYAGAAKRRLKTAFKACVFCAAPEAALLYDGPRTAEELWDFERDGKHPFRDIRRVGVQQASVQRCRPIFAPWSIKFDLTLIPDAGVNVSDVREAVEIAGKQIGLSDYRPKYGRFVVEKFKVQ